MLLVTSRCVRPSCPAFTRSTFRFSCGCSNTWWMCTSAAPGIAATCSPQPLRDRVVRRGVVADHLHVDRRGQAEVQDLVRDVRRLEEEHHVGEFLGQPFAQQDFVVAHGPVPLAIERDRESPRRSRRCSARRPGRGCPRRSGSRCCRGWCRSRPPAGCREFPARRRRSGASVSSIRVPGGMRACRRMRAGVNVGEEVAADHRHQQQRAERHRHEPDQHRRPRAGATGSSRPM